MKKETMILKFTFIFLGFLVLVLCILGVIWLAKNPVNPKYAHAIYPILIGFFLTTIPFYAVLHQAIKILNYVDQNKAFSNLSVTALKNIKHFAIIISALYVVILPFVYLLSEKDDAPGLIIIGMIPIFVSSVFAVFTAVLQKLFKNALDIKS